MPKKPIKPMAPRVPQDAFDWMAETWPTANAAAEWILGTFPTIYRRTLAELRGKFSRGELCMMIDVMNGAAALMVYGGGTGLAGQHLPLSVADSFSLYPGDFEEKWSIEANTLNTKIAGLTHFQLVCLEIWAASFWEGDYQAADAIDNHCKILEG